MKAYNFFFLLAGETISTMLSAYGISAAKLESDMTDMTDIEEVMNDTAFGHDSFDECEHEAKEALRESRVPFAVVFQGSKIYAYISNEKTATFETM